MLNAILVSVDYTDFLRLTLPWNRRHFDRVMVVTSTADQVNVLPVARENGCQVYATDSFYCDGANFNKWAAMEEGLDALGREGWLCIMDADVLWPREIDYGWWRGVMEGGPGRLFTPRRRMCEAVPPVLPWEGEWGRYPLHPQQREFAGYTQIFHADDPVLGPAPWHQTNWRHAGGADSFFQAKWSEKNKVRPPFEVLHLGPAGTNWCGRATNYLDGRTNPLMGRRRQQLQDYMAGRRRGRAPGDDPFAHEKLPPPSSP